MYKPKHVPFDDFFVKCGHCGQSFSPREMDDELDDVCSNCVAAVMTTAKNRLEDELLPNDFALFERILEVYADGAL